MNPANAAAKPPNGAVYLHEGKYFVSFSIVNAASESPRLYFHIDSADLTHSQFHEFHRHRVGYQHHRKR